MGRLFFSPLLFDHHFFFAATGPGKPQNIRCRPNYIRPRTGAAQWAPWAVFPPTLPNGATSAPRVFPLKTFFFPFPEGIQGRDKGGRRAPRQTEWPLLLFFPGRVRTKQAQRGVRRSLPPSPPPLLSAPFLLSFLGIFTRR